MRPRWRSSANLGNRSSVEDFPAVLLVETGFAGITSSAIRMGCVTGGLDRREVGGQEPGGGEETDHRLDGRDPPAGLPLEIGQEVADGEGVLRLLRAEEGDLRTLGQFRGEIFGGLTGTAYAGEAGERAHLPPACGASSDAVRFTALARRIDSGEDGAVLAVAYLEGPSHLSRGNQGPILCRDGVGDARNLDFIEKMAPEVGLEPTTPRLTAACSTIELLWNSATGAQRSGAFSVPSKGFLLFSVLRLHAIAARSGRDARHRTLSSSP